MSLRKYITLVEDVVEFPGGSTAPFSTTPNVSHPTLDEFTKGYAEIALHIFERKYHREPDWSELEPQTARAFVEDCKRFQGLNGKLLQQAYAAGLKPYDAGSAFYALRNGVRSKDWLGLGNLWHAMDRAANVDLFPPFRLVDQDGTIKAEYEENAMAESAGPVDLDCVDLYIREAILREFSRDGEEIDPEERRRAWDDADRFAQAHQDWDKTRNEPGAGDKLDAETLAHGRRSRLVRGEKPIPQGGSKEPSRALLRDPQLRKLKGIFLNLRKQKRNAMDRDDQVEYDRMMTSIEDQAFDLATKYRVAAATVIGLIKSSDAVYASGDDAADAIYRMIDDPDHWGPND